MADQNRDRAEDAASAAFQQWAATGAVPVGYLETVLGKDAPGATNGSVSTAVQTSPLNVTRKPVR